MTATFPKKLSFQNVFCPHKNGKHAFSNCSGLKSVSGKLRFRDGLVLTVGLIGNIKLRFRGGLVLTVGLIGNIKLRFRGRISVDGRPNWKYKAAFW